MWECTATTGNNLECYQATDGKGPFQYIYDRLTGKIINSKNTKTATCTASGMKWERLDGTLLNTWNRAGLSIDTMANNYFVKNFVYFLTSVL